MNGPLCADAAYLTSKMTDNGVHSAHVFGPDGNEIEIEEVYSLGRLHKLALPLGL